VKFEVYHIPAEGVARESERELITGVPQSTWRQLQDEGKAPLPIPLTAATVGWLRRELLDWVEQQAAKRADTWQPLGEAVARVIKKVAP
jgi:predicted DNA-binding transcriptional regulator AlpA